MKVIPLIAAGDNAIRASAQLAIEQERERAIDDVERLTSRLRTVEIAYLDQQATIDALRLDLVAAECRIARLELSLPAGQYEARKAPLEG